MNLKIKTLLLFVQAYEKKKEVPYMEMSLDNAQNRKESPLLEKSLDNDQKRCKYKKRNAAQKHSLTFFHKNKSLLAATSILSRSPMAYNTTASLDKLTRTNYVDFGKCQDRFGRFS